MLRKSYLLAPVITFMAWQEVTSSHCLISLQNMTT